MEAHSNLAHRVTVLNPQWIQPNPTHLVFSAICHAAAHNKHALDTAWENAPAKSYLLRSVLRSSKRYLSLHFSYYLMLLVFTE